MNVSTHQNALAAGGSTIAVTLLIKLAAHFGYTLDTSTALEVLALVNGGAVYVSQALAARGVKLPTLPSEAEPVVAPVVAAVPAS